MKRITIYDVAKEADVSLATVSRVINDSSVVREDTRLRVQEVIERLGYKPNAVAQGLALSKTTTVSIVMSEKLLAYNAKILNGLMDVANIYHYNVMFHTTSKGISKMQDVIESIIKSRVDGVILFNDNFSEEEMNVLNEYKIPMVIVGGKFDGPKHDHVGNVYVDIEKIASQLVKDYFAKGIDDIAIVEDKLNLSMMKQMKKGAEEAFKEAGKEFENYLSYNDTYKTSYEYFSDYLKENKPHKLNICFRDSQAIALLNAAKENGYKVPEDLEIITILDSKYLPMMRPTITAYNIPDYDMGALAMRMLTKMLVSNDDKGVEKSIEIQASPLIRETTK
ncbi:LacI family DNA-binding transcriptional regulator [Erysipelotrichaceae bacterium 51-3]|uniref:LacI family DNA-binding transcriptional regulator n=1 Tax=Allobaculum sp. JKK-2023 TaxID=3108943 RepID=UPI002B05324D|nr:LacI family DNA-binding transcriptional regulator [Allobaculum sp. JKK-2023]